MTRIVPFYTLGELMDDLEEEWPQGMPPEIIHVRAELDGNMYVVEGVRFSAPTEGEMIILELKKEE